jgi:ATP-dependent Zn protease
MLTDLELVAYHEAGHATVAWSLGFKLRAIRIDAESGASATEIYEDSPPTLFQRALVLLAGGRAEKIADHTSLSRRLSPLLDDASLRTMLQEKLHFRLILRPVEYVEAIEARMDQRLSACCERLVKKQWESIERLAAALKRHPEIDGAYAERLLRDDDRNHRSADH